MNKEVIGAIVGTSVSATGTAMQTSEVLQIISLVLTILGSVITITMAVINWWKKAKVDGKIEKEEVNLTEKMDYIRDYARVHKHFSFKDLLLTQKTKMQVVVSFLAILELMKVGFIKVVQEDIFDDIIIDCIGE